MEKHVHLKIKKEFPNGGYRFSCMEAAYKFGIVGFVRNINNSLVYIEAEGFHSNVDRFVEWCRKGPVGAKILEFEIETGIPKKYKSFEIVIEE